MLGTDVSRDCVARARTTHPDIEFQVLDAFDLGAVLALGRAFTAVYLDLSIGQRRPLANRWRFVIGGEQARGQTAARRPKETTMLRQRSPARVRADAIRMGVRKLRAGCTSCADGYFKLAMDNGASEAEVQAALAREKRRDPHNDLSRRQVLKTAGATVAGLATSLVAGGFLPGLASAAAAPASAGSVHWLLGLTGAPPGTGGPQQTSLAGPLSMVGFDGVGDVAGRIDSVANTIFRSEDGGHLYLPWSRWDGAGTSLVVEDFSGATGEHLRTIAGAHLPLQGATAMWEELAFDVTAGDRLLVVLRTTWRTSGDAGSKETPARTSSSVALGVEVVDLAAGRAVDHLELARLGGQEAAGGVVNASARGDRITVIGRRFDGTFHDATTSVAFDGSRLSVSAHGQVPFAEPLASRVTADGGTLVRYHPPYVDFVDLDRLTLARRLTVPIDTSTDPRFPPRPLAVFSPDGSTLYLGNQGDGTVRAIDVAARSQRAMVELPSPPDQDTHQRQRVDDRNPFTVAVSPDGATLYMVENRGTFAGVWAVRLPGLVPLGRLLDAHLATAVAPSPDGSGLAVLSQPEQRLYLLKTDGTVVAHVDAANAYSFARRDRACVPGGQPMGPARRQL